MLLALIVRCLVRHRAHPFASAVQARAHEGTEGLLVAVDMEDSLAVAMDLQCRTEGVGTAAEEVWGPQHPASSALVEGRTHRGPIRIDDRRRSQACTTARELVRVREIATLLEERVAKSQAHALT